MKRLLFALSCVCFSAQAQILAPILFNTSVTPKHVQTVCAAGGGPTSGACPANESGSAAHTTVTASINASTGNSLRVALGSYPAGSVVGGNPTCYDGVNTYTADTQNTTTAGSLSIFHADGITGGSLSIVCTYQELQLIIMFVSEFSGITGTVDGTPSQVLSSSSTSILSPTITTSNASDLIYVAYTSGTGGTSAQTINNGFTIPANGAFYPGNNQVAGAVAYNFVTSTGSYSASFGVSPASVGRIGIAAYKTQ